MDNILLVILVFIKLLKLVIIFDVILSWLNFFWLRITINFVKNITNPLYSMIWNLIPTRFWIFSLSALIIFLILIFLEGLIGAYDKNIILKFNELINF